MSSETNNSHNPLSESELDQVSGGGLTDAFGKIKKPKDEKPPFTTLPIDIKPE